jgi:hypothetical protein
MVLTTDRLLGNSLTPNFKEKQMNLQANMTMTAPAISVPSVSNASMLVELSIGSWTGRKLDKRASQDVTDHAKAAKGVANVHKKLLGDCAELDAVQKFVANARNIHYSSTAPWSDTGLRILPTARYFKYHEQMTGLQDEFARLVDAFLQAYDWEISQSQVKLGDLFNPDEYPTADSLRCKFRFKINYIPLPAVGDWRVDMEQDALNTLKDHYEQFYSNQLQSALKDVWSRTHDALSKMSERLDYTDDKTRKIFRDSLVENVLEVVDLLGDFNITGDAQMTAMKDKLEDAMRGVTPEALREDAYLRPETKRQVDEVLKSLPTLDI